MKKRLLLTMTLFLVCVEYSTSRETFITIYNQNIAVVREIRNVEIDQNKKLVFSDIAGQIDPTSVKLSIPNVEVLEQNYEYDLVNQEKLLQSRVGQQVDLILEKGELLSGKLLTPGGWGVVLETPSGLRLIQGGIQQVLLSGNSEGMFLKPTLIWMLDKQSKGKVPAELTYITNGISWKCEYVVLLNENGVNLDLQGWVDIQNNSGASYPDATIKLIAGDINRVYPNRFMQRKSEVGFTLDAGSVAEQFSQRELFEYHLYELQRKSTISDRQNKQISLLAVNQVPYQQEYHYSANQGNKKVQVKVLFKNDKQSNLERPLPSGRVRLFQADVKGNREFIGEDNIDHTPILSEIKLNVGDAFDVTGETIQKNFRNISNRVTETDYQVELKNSKIKDIVVNVTVSGYGDWSITKSSEEVVNISSQEKKIEVKIPSKSSKTITYTIRQS